MEPLTLDLVKRALLKRLWPIAAVSLVAVVLSLGVAYVLPPTYVAGAKILVESQQIPTDLAQSTVTASASERLELIRQRLMTRDNLSALIRDLGLYSDRDDMSVSDKVAKARESTSFEKIAINRGRRGSEVAAFVLSFRSGKPDVAARMANELVTLVLEQNLAARSRRASETLEFFDEEVQRLQEERVAAQKALAEFKKENSEALPAGESYRRNELSAVQDRRYDLERSLLEQRGRLRDMRQRLEAGIYGPEYAENASPQENRLAELERDLSQASALYSPSHPTIRRLRSQIAQLENSIGLDSDSRDNDADRETLKAQARRALEEDIAELEKRISIAEEELANLSERKAKIEDAIARSPRVALELNELENRLSAIQAQLGTAVSKRAAAETGQKLEVNQQAERFEIIEQAQVPDDPVSPERGKIALLGSGAGIGLALGLAVLLEMLNRALHTGADLERTLQLRPLSTIPFIETAADRRKRLIRLLSIAAVAVGGPLAALAALHQFYLPLDLIWEKVLERSGLGQFIDLLLERF